MTYKRVLVGLLAGFVLSLAGGVRLTAQTTTASVSGAVRDAQGGVLAGAEVVLTSNTQGTTQATTSDARGNFVFPYVRPDSYSLKVALAGFKVAERLNMVVNANDKLNAGIITLEIGEITESITVSDRVTELQATSGERSYTLESAAITNLTANGRTFWSLVGLVPGVVTGVQQDNDWPTTTTPTQASQFAVHGQRPNSNNMTIDGVANIDTGDNGGNMTTTSLDSIAEFKVLTSSYQAEYGRATGAQVQVVTKSGGRSFSGSAYWYARDSEWNANTWTNNRAGIEKTEASRKDRGYTIGGPAFIPGKFNGDKKKLFFFWSQEFQNVNDPVNEQRVTVPTALERAGDFSQSVDASGNPFPYIRDYTTGLPCEAGDTRGCFADGGVLGKIPQDRLYAPSLASLSVYPTPNVSGQPGYNYSSQEPSDLPRREDLVRIDFHPSDNWRFMGRYMHTSDPQGQPYGVGWAVGGNLDTLQGYRHQPGYNWMLSAVGVLNSTTALEISFGSGHNSLDISGDNPLLKRSASEIQNLPMLFPDAVQEDFIPRFQFGGGRVGNPALYSTHQAPFTNYNTTYDAILNLTKTMDAHTIKAGVYYQHSKKDQSPFAGFNGTINFQNSASNPYDTGHPYANAATGVFYNFAQMSMYQKPKYRYSNIEWYIQDNWKTGRKLTLDYGVRFYYVTPLWDASQILSTFRADAYDPSQAVRLIRPGLDAAGNRIGVDAVTGQTWDAGMIGRVVPNSGNRFNGSFQAGQGIDKTMSDGAKFCVSPRFGFAYDITGRQSAILRGAFGIFYDRPQGNTLFNMAGNPPSAENVQLEQGRLQDLSSATPMPGPLASTPVIYNWKVPKTMGWNVGMQFKLPSQFVWDIAYIGNSGSDLLWRKQLNAVPYGAKFLPENQDPTLAASTIPGATALSDNFLRPYPGYTNIQEWQFEAVSNYHALQTSLNRRFDKGLLLGIAYTFSKALGDASNDYSGARIDGKDREANYGLLRQDRPHSLMANFVYQTPKVASGPMGLLLNGWQISGVYRFLYGGPYQVQFNIPGINAGNLTGSDNNQGARIVTTGDPGKGWNTSDPYAQFDTTVFAPPQPGSIGNESALYVGVYSPPVNNVDLTLSKSFMFDDKRKLEFRVDAFNALNHTQGQTINRTANFTSLTDPTITNLPYDASGNLVNRNGFGSIASVWPARTIQLVARFVF
ncbi:MAG: carboxypeptidase regulatory-like domain-containing protein [Vicinamibacteria bacterium]|nr:carboxypeptidase regulatory-like domain-containing protein [Vicinamibacteria bacterium]